MATAARMQGSEGDPAERIRANVPAEMLEAPRWVMWRWRIRQGKRTKVPYTPGTVSEAKSNEPATWRTFDTACNSAFKYQDADGIGFVLGDGYCGADLDRVRDPETGELQPWAQEIVEQIDSYSEASPTGTGVHVLVYSDAPTPDGARGHNKRDYEGGAVEMYADGRFFTITGDRLAIASPQLERRPAEFNAVWSRFWPAPAPTSKAARAEQRKSARRDETTGLPDDDALIAEAKAATNGAKFSRLWDGDTSGYPSTSEADAALVLMLAFWTEDDDVAIDRLFRRSGLMRDKWDKRDGSGTYGSRTIERTLAIPHETRRRRSNQNSDRRPDRQTEQPDPEPIEADKLLQRLLEAKSVDALFRATNELAALDASEYGRIKSALKSTYGKALNLNDLDAAVRSKRIDDADSEKRPITKIVADEIAAAGMHFAVDAGGRLWVFRDGVYAPNGAATVHRLVKALMTGPLSMPELWSTHQSDEVVAYISVDAPELWERPPLDRLNVRNGILHLNTHKLDPHTPEFLSPVQLPITYDPRATCPAWERFVASTFPDDAQQLAWEIVAYLMTADMSIQKAILLVGEGGNGKSTFLTAVIAFLGKHNTSAIPLQKLEVDRFAAARLVGKLANICADLPSVALAGTSVFKAITGGDAITAELKFKESFDLQPFARLVFSANTPPQSPDATQAFYDRWIAIPFTGRFRATEGEIDRETLDAQLSDPAELSGVLNKALQALEQLRRCRRFSEPKSVKEELARFREVTDPFVIWLDTHTLAHPDAVVAKEDLWKAYRKHAEKRGFPAGTENAFSRALKRARPSLDDAQRTWKGRSKTWVWLGIGLPSPEPGDGSQDSRHSRDYPSISQTHAPLLFDQDSSTNEMGGYPPIV